MNQNEAFKQEVKDNINNLSLDTDLKGLSNIWIRETTRKKYSYNFTWLGRPIIQYPQDMIAIQELIWLIKPDLIIETGIAHGGSLILSASILELIGAPGSVVGIDIDIREHNRDAIENHPLSHRIKLIEGSSIDPNIIDQVTCMSLGKEKIMVFLDSNHTHGHVAKELDAYARLVTKGSYLVVFDTSIDDMPDDMFPDREWGKGNNPKTAVKDFLNTTERFHIDKSLESKLLITVAPNGFLKCVK